MADPLDRFEYRVMPWSGEWITYSAMLYALALWNQGESESGAPALTISKRLRPDADQP